LTLAQLSNRKLIKCFYSVFVNIGLSRQPFGGDRYH